MVRLLAEDFENYGTDRVLPFGSFTMVPGWFADFRLGIILGYFSVPI